MSNRIATNFEYQAEDFLDKRQGWAKSKDDLKSWSIPVPKGFKLCLNNIWYYYDPTKNLQDTGHWIPTIINDLRNIDDPNNQTVGAGIIEDIQEDVGVLEEGLKDLDNSIFPTSIGSIAIGPAYIGESNINLAKGDWVAKISQNISSQLPYDDELDWNADGSINEKDITKVTEVFNAILSSKQTKGTGVSYTLEFGETIFPKITWKVVRPLVTWKLTPSMAVVWSVVPGTENNTVPIKSSTVTTNIRGTVSKDGLSWTARELVTSNRKATFSFKIISKVSDKIQVDGSASLVFEHKRWTGVGGLDLWSKDVIKPWELGFSSAFTSSGAMPNTNFNCSGGKYPYILIPKDYYSASRKTYVNNNLNSDFLVKDVTVINSKGVSIPFKMYRANYIQTGSAISIKIE